eukprot:253539_1
MLISPNRKRKKQNGRAKSQSSFQQNGGNNQNRKKHQIKNKNRDGKNSNFEIHTFSDTILCNLFENEYETFGKLHNESVMLHCAAYYVLFDDEIIDGEIHLTNFLLYFVANQMSDIPNGHSTHLVLPIASIAKITKQQRSNGYTEIVLTNRIYKQVRFRLDCIESSLLSPDRVIQMLRALAFPNRMVDLFAFEYFKRHPIHSKVIKMQTPQRDDEEQKSNDNTIWGWHTYNIKREYNRMGVYDEDDINYRFSKVNAKYEICDSYPQLFVVPSSITDWELQQVSRFRRLGRIPILSWKSRTNNVALFRCSQPKVAMASNRSRADEHLIQSIVDANDANSNSTLYIMDARPKLNARVNKMRGGGFENVNFYKNAKLEFLNIDNIHIMRKSRKTLSSLVGSVSKDNKDWYQSLSATEWMAHIRELLRGAVKMIHVLLDLKCSILCHCSDGWDRTSQLCSIVELCLDPYYRTMKGFIVLICKEWLSVGHQFDKRCGHRKDDAEEDDERSPIFEQFIECVYQLLRQYPFHFEFNDDLLICILDHLYSCKYGTFLCDNLKKRQEYKLSQRTLSLWTHIQNCSNSHEFINIFYEPQQANTENNCILIPKYSLKILKFWNKWHFRNAPMFHDDGYTQICKRFEALNKQNEALRKEIVKLKIKQSVVVEIESD